MKKCLYIDCCIRREDSRTKQLADAFLENLEGYEIEHLILENENLKPLVGDFYFDREKLLEADNRTHERFRYAWQFKDADMIVIACPFWDLSFPALFKIYIENISVDGITFGSTENGLVGLCKASNLIYLTTRGGIFKENNPMDLGTPYINAFGPYYGIDNIHIIAADGLDIVGYDGITSLNEAKQKAINLAKNIK